MWRLLHRRQAEVRLVETVEDVKAVVRADYVEQVLAGLAELGPEGWQALSVQAKRDIFDIVLDRVIVYPKENPHKRWAPPHMIKVLWRQPAYRPASGPAG
jgi:hypothetical protein